MNAGTRVISFASGKGGVGKTSLVANLGHLMARLGRRTLLIDGDWNLGKLGITLGVTPQWTIERVLDGTIELVGAIGGVAENLFLLASPSGKVGWEELNEETRNQLFFELDRLRNQYDYVLIDHSSGVHWNVLQFAAASHQHIIVTTPEPTSYTDAYAIMKLLSKRFGVRDFAILVTHSPGDRETRKVFRRFSDLTCGNLGVRVELLDVIPWDGRLSEAIRKRTPFVSLYPESEMTKRLTEIVHRIEATSPSSSHGLRFFYQPEL